MGPQNRLPAVELIGRQPLVDLVWSQLLERVGGEPSPPVVALLGPRGSGKTAVLEHLAQRCRGRGAQPFAPVLDLSRPRGHQHAWQVLDWLARQLGARYWPMFGRLRFPRFALGRIIAEGAVTTTSLDQTLREIEALLRQAGRLDQAADNVSQLAAQLPDLLGLTSWLRLLGLLGSRFIASRLMVRLRWRTGMRFYAEALQAYANGGYLALTELSQLSARTDAVGRASLNRVLCEAFLADLAEVYRHGFRPRNCLALVDNVDDDTGLGAALVAALAAAGARAAHPMVMVVTSSTTSPVKALLADDRDTRVEDRLRPDRSVSLADWRAVRGGLPSAVYPVRLGDFDRDGVELVARAVHPEAVRWAGFVYSLTRGHPWGVRHTLETLAALYKTTGRALDEGDLRGVLDAPCPSLRGSLGDVATDLLLVSALPRPLRTRMPACAAALEMSTAKRAGLADQQPLETELADRLWLVTDGPPGSPQTALHPWARRLLLRRLAAGPSWTDVFDALRAVSPDGSVPALYYDLAAGRIQPAVTWLAERFERIDHNGPVTAETWIAELNAITAAPRQHLDRCDAYDHHQKLLGAHSDPTRDDTWRTILGVVTARWIWADPLGDPTLSLNQVLKHDFQLLSAHPEGERRLIAEAEFYERGGRP